MNSEERYCQAERDYDAMREELLMPTPDDHRDESEWRDFLETKVRYYSNVMLSKATTDLLQERADRLPSDQPQPFLDKVGEVGGELQDFHNEFTKGEK